MMFIKAHHTISRCKIRTKDGLTDAIPMNAGVRQGCPLRAIMFNLTIEHVLRHIDEDTSIPGVRVNNREVKILAYADDLLLTSPNPDAL